MRVSTYQKKLSAVLKSRPHFESEHINATVTLTGDDYKPMIDLNISGNGASLDLVEANDFATWVKKVAK